MHSAGPAAPSPLRPPREACEWTLAAWDTVGLLLTRPPEQRFSVRHARRLCGLALCPTLALMTTAGSHWDGQATMTAAEKTMALPGSLNQEVSEKREERSE